MMTPPHGYCCRMALPAASSVDAPIEQPKGLPEKREKTREEQGKVVPGTRTVDTQLNLRPGCQGVCAPSQRPKLHHPAVAPCATPGHIRLRPGVPCQDASRFEVHVSLRSRKAWTWAWTMGNNNMKPARRDTAAHPHSRGHTLPEQSTAEIAQSSRFTGFIVNKHSSGYAT